MDSSSSAYYVIIIYKNLQGEYSLTSLELLNVPKTPNYQAPITGNDILQIPYFSAMQNALTANLNKILVAGTVLDQLYKDFPYFKLVYHNDAMSKINVELTYDAIKKNLTVLGTSALGYPAQQPTGPTAQPQPQPQPQPQLSCGT
jgi:hypothetical protein